jgi:hypothetical protein
LLQILLVAALDIKTRDVPTVSSVNSLLSQYCKASHFFFANFYVWGGAPTVRFAPVVTWAKTGPDGKRLLKFRCSLVSSSSTAEIFRRISAAVILKTFQRNILAYKNVFRPILKI